MLKQQARVLGVNPSGLPLGPLTVGLRASKSLSVELESGCAAISWDVAAGALLDEEEAFDGRAAAALVRESDAAVCIAVASR